MKLVLLIESPVTGTSYEHGLELALTMADMDIEVAVLFAGLAALDIMAFADDRVKKAGQLNLFDIKTGLYCIDADSRLHESLDFIQTVDKEQFIYILDNAQKIVRF